MLDAEMKKLLDTIRQSSELVNSGLTPDHDNDTNNGSESNNVGSDADMLFVKGLDFKAIFEQATIAFGVASLDGRFLHCNSTFARVSGYSMKELEKQNVFNLLARNEIENAYKALGRFLKEPVTMKNGEDFGKVDDGGSNECSEGESKPVPYFWSGKLQQPNVSYWLL